MRKINNSTYMGLIVILICSLISIKFNNNTIVVIIGAIVGTLMLIFLKINKHPVRLIYAQIIYICVVKFAISCLHIPNSANYLTDVFTILIVIFALIELREKKTKVNIGLPALLIIVLFLVTICGFIVNRQSILLYIWAFRNNFRFFGFFFGCVVLLKKKDIDNILKILLLISIINTLFVTVQYFAFGLQQDVLGGIFGKDSGVNAYMNIFICVVCIIALVQYISKKISVSLLIFVICSNLYIAALSELKMFFVEFVIIIGCFMLFSKLSKKMILIVFGCSIAIFAGTQLLYAVFPYFKDFFNIDTMIAQGNTYSSSTDLGRLTAAQTVTDMFLSDHKLRLFFGLGLGSAETSQIAMFSSPFFNQYGETLHYTWLSSAFMLIENGWLGLISYLLFFISIIPSSFKIRKKNIENFDYCIMAQVFAVLCCIIVFYNVSLRTEAGYLAYFMLALPFIIDKKELRKDHI